MQLSRLERKHPWLPRRPAPSSRCAPARRIQKAFFAPRPERKHPQCRNAHEVSVHRRDWSASVPACHERQARKSRQHSRRQITSALRRQAPLQAGTLALQSRRVQSVKASLSAGVLAFIVARIVAGAGLSDAVDHAVYEVLRGEEDHQETFDALDKAIRLARDASRPPTPESVEALGGGWVGEEALAIAVYCALVHENDLRRALLLAVNHSGDSDSTGSIAGNILGALHGTAAIPPEWLEQLELRTEIERLANDLHAASCPNAETRTK